MSREQRVNRAIIELADTLHEQFDIAEFLRRLAQLSVDLLGADGARVMLSDNHEALQVVATSSPPEGLAGLPSPAFADGPGPQAYATARPVTSADLDADPTAWPDYATAGHAAGFRSVLALPMSHHNHVIGAIEVCRSATGHVATADAELATTLVQLATVSVLRERRRQQADTLAGQLQRALDSRLVIEQAKGVLAERTQLGVDQAFALLRGHARRHRMRLAALAAQVIDGTYDTTRLVQTESRVRSGPVPTRRGGRTGAAVRASTSNDRRSRNGS
jgi:GAF domain-containing protein